MNFLMRKKEVWKDKNWRTVKVWDSVLLSSSLKQKDSLKDKTFQFWIWEEEDSMSIGIGSFYLYDSENYEIKIEVEKDWTIFISSIPEITLSKYKELSSIKQIEISLI